MCQFDHSGCYYLYICVCVARPGRHLPDMMITLTTNIADIQPTTQPPPVNACFTLTWS